MHKLEDGLKDLQVEHCYELRGVLALLEAHREAQIGGVVEVREGVVPHAGVRGPGERTKQVRALERTQPAIP